VKRKKRREQKGRGQTFEKKKGENISENFDCETIKEKERKRTEGKGKLNSERGKSE
jgi:hypothetical protein